MPHYMTVGLDNFAAGNHKTDNTPNNNNKIYYL